MIDCIVETVMEAHLTEQSGDILIFRSGTYQIQKIISKINLLVNGDEDTKPRYSPNQVSVLDCYPLHARLS